MENQDRGSSTKIKITQRKRCDSLLPNLNTPLSLINSSPRLIKIKKLMANKTQKRSSSSPQVARNNYQSQPKLTPIRVEQEITTDLKSRSILQDAKEKLVEIQRLERYAENYIYDYFEDVKKQVDLRRGDLKHKIDTYADEIIKSIEKDHMNYKKFSKEINKLSMHIEISKKELEKSVIQFDNLEFNNKKFEDIIAREAVLDQGFKKILDEHKESLIGHKKYKFDYKEISIEEFFGRLTEFQVTGIYFSFIY